mgnify:FL=1
MQQIRITSTSTQTVSLAIPIKDRVVGTMTYSGLLGNIEGVAFVIELESQQTNKVKRFIPHNQLARQMVSSQLTLPLVIDRFALFKYKITVTGDDAFNLGQVKIGNDDFPLGLYNIRVWQSPTLADYNPDNATAFLHYGIMNIYTSEVGGTEIYPSVQYKQYNNNDSDTNSVYITNTI